MFVSMCECVCARAFVRSVCAFECADGGCGVGGPF